jgi:soluble lytic murein transglycosylase-like protein
MTGNLNFSRFGLALLTMVRDIREGFVEITHHSMALVGLAVVAVTLTFVTRPDLQTSASEALLGWLEMRQAETQLENQDLAQEQDAASRSTATALKHLSKEQLAVTYSLSRRYRVSPEPLGALVTEAWALGERSQIAPTLLLAVMAIESKFNPFATGPQGGLGLMQIEPESQAENLRPFGGRLAAFDPVTNLRLGARQLQALLQSAPSLEDALRLYAGVSGQSDDEQYVDRVLTEQKQLDKIIAGLPTTSAAEPTTRRGRNTPS